MVIKIDEPINVGVVFSRGEVRPVWFSWKGRQVKIKETAFTWKSREGSAVILHFSVTDGQGLYEVCYNMESLGWSIARSEEQELLFSPQRPRRSRRKAKA